jgi:hypothetical protein
MQVDTTGLKLADSDMLVVLLKRRGLNYNWGFPRDPGFPLVGGRHLLRSS